MVWGTCEMSVFESRAGRAGLTSNCSWGAAAEVSILSTSLVSPCTENKVVRNAKGRESKQRRGEKGERNGSVISTHVLHFFEHKQLYKE